MSIVVRYTPTEEGSHSCTLTIVSDDPDENPITIGLHGTTPTTIIDIPSDLAFRPEVVQRMLEAHRAGVCDYGDQLFGVLAVQQWDELFLQRPSLEAP